MIATGFITNGAKVYITGRDAPACHAAVGDLQELDECQALAASLARLEPGGLHVLFNNAGAAWGADLDSHPDAAWTKLLTLSLQPAARLHPDAAVPAAAREGRQPGRPARVVHVGSIDGLHHLSRHIARDLGSRNVTTNVLACGRFRTRMMKAALDAAEDVLTENIPLRRIGRDEDVAGSAVFWRARLGEVMFFLYHLVVSFFPSFRTNM
ncbi:hypothetical protein J3458_005674 [Metarhizium acridum]|uniref:uncharacterized protein n=1 Tax=Metarhizium acridum TaxID=92637 RepID=UPI001C6B145D|nr:hypothetical protein J3458_005674 [Metarhizium acridum]